MKTMSKFVVLCLSLITIIGCSSIVSMTYSAQSLPRGENAMNADIFKYLPADNKKVLQNQIQNTAGTDILLDKDVREYVKNAFQLELERSGYFSLTPKTTLNCDIMRLEADDLGFSVDLYLDITCHFIDNTTKTETATESVNIAKKRLEKFGGLDNVQRALNNSIFEAYEKIISSPKVQKALR